MHLSKRIVSASNRLLAHRVPLLQASVSVRCHGSSNHHFPGLKFGGKPSEEQHKTSILAELSNTPGSLYDVLKYFWKYDVNLTHIESRPNTESNNFNVYIDFDGRIGDPNIDKLMVEIKNQCKANMLVLDQKEVPWFPRHITDLDLIANRTLDAGADLESDHPGFHDPVYRARRQELASIAQHYKIGQPIPYIQYQDVELQTWQAVYSRLESLQNECACKEYIAIMPLMQRYCGFSETNIPQVQDISDFLQRRTGFRLRPVAGLLSSRDFLNGLAFRVFFSTQYIRHSSKPFYTPEPDICHELLGHAPMFADPDFADFSQEIGLASLGASDHDIKRLATCYWHSVEFGLLKEGDKKKAYGAGLLSSFGELSYACQVNQGPNDPKPQYRPWDPEEASVTAYPICNYQPTYFVAENMNDAKLKMRDFCEKLQKPFHARYNALTSSVWVDRAVRTRFYKEVKGPY